MTGDVLCANGQTMHLTACDSKIRMHKHDADDDRSDLPGSYGRISVLRRLM